MRKRHNCLVCSIEFFSKNVNPKFCSLGCKYSSGHTQKTINKIKEARANQVMKTRPIIRSGYIYIKDWTHPLCGQQGYVAEHRIVMEKSIGRFLTKKETIHHINHDPTDNRIENLQLFASHGEHTKFAHPEILKKSSIANKGKRRSINTEFKKGQIPWNKSQNPVLIPLI